MGGSPLKSLRTTRHGAQWDALQDPSNDGYPNIIKYLTNTNPQNPSSIPTPNIVVDPTGNGNFTTLAAAWSSLNSSARTGAQIILVKPGFYTVSNLTDSTNLSNCAVQIRASDPNPYHTIIQVTAGANGFTIANASAFIIAGFTIQKDPTEAFQNYYAVDSSPETLIKNCIFPSSTWQEPLELNNALVQNCLFSNNSAIYEINEVLPTASGILQILNCTFYNNSGLSIATANYSPITLTNCILYDPNGSQLANVIASSTVTNCDILGGWSYGTNILNANPQLTTQGWPTKTSPTIGQGTPVSLVDDLFNQTLSTTTPDIGAIQWVDTNGQGLPDWWQLYWWGTLGESPTATGPSGLTYAQDYYYDTNPFLASTSGDTITDAQKVAAGLNPVLLSNSSSGIPDGIQIANGLNPLLDNSFSDVYGYRYPNIFEYTHTGTLNDKANPPTPDYTVGPTQTYKTISSALTSWYNGGNPSIRNPIFLVQDGTYNEDVVIPNLAENYNILIISEHGPQKTIIAGDSGAPLNIQGNTVIDGFTITKQAGAHGTAILTTSDGYEARGAEINHCVITGCYSSTNLIIDDAPTVFHSCIFKNNVLSLASNTGPQLFYAYNYTELDNCTITDTRTSPSGPLFQSQVFYVMWGNVVINNSVIYNPAVTSLYNFYVYSGSTIKVFNSFVGTFSASSQVTYTNCSNQNPQISLEGYPLSSSPVLTWNGPSPLSNDQLDTFLFPRVAGQNTGALGFTNDTTGNGLNGVGNELFRYHWPKRKQYRGIRSYISASLHLRNQPNGIFKLGRHGL